MIIRCGEHSAASLFVTICLALSGCWTPLRSVGVPASALPDRFRTPYRSMARPLNLSNLTLRPPQDYILGGHDILEVSIPDLYDGAAIRPLRVQVMSSGEIQLPLAGAIRVGGMNLLQAQQEITRVFADGILVRPRVNVALAQKSMIDLLVLGEVNAPGIYSLPKYENDVGHGLAAAGGFSRDAAEMVEVHRRISQFESENYETRKDLEFIEAHPNDPKKILKIPLRGLPRGFLYPDDVVLYPGDVVVVPSRKNEVFFVVGLLDESNLVRFTLGDRERELGSGLVLPRDRDIDVVTAVAMAGYIDPIESPTTVTVHRHLESGNSMLIKVDLIKARYDCKETVLVRAGDIIYVNPDAPWWFRRTFDRIVPDLLLLPYSNWMSRVFLGPRFKGLGPERRVSGRCRCRRCRGSQLHPRRPPSDRTRTRPGPVRYPPGPGRRRRPRL